jgi:hypothetical protein
VLWNDEQLDASGDAWFSADQSGAMEIDDHLMDGRWAGSKMALYVGFGWRLSEHRRIDVDESQVGALLFDEALRSAATRAV